MKPQHRSSPAPAAPRVHLPPPAQRRAAQVVERAHDLLRWPTPALVGWLACAAFWMVLERLGWSPLLAWVAGVTLGLALTLIMIERGESHLRVVMMAAGFPLASVVNALAHRGALGAGTVPAWLWLAPLGLLLLLYPLRAWRDAPLYPTEHAALDRVADLLPLAPGARVLDAGCGLGDGLNALRRVWPLAQLEGVEWSRPIAWLARLRCPGALIHRGDMWAHSWAGLDVVYLFQRPESMPRALAKARAEMREGAWLVSLEFEAHDARPHAQLRTPGGKPIWIYHLPARGARPVLATLAGRAAATTVRPALEPAGRDGATHRGHQPQG
jgi:hypothetical protein